jgi:multidrug transporter EmrE-like cation transporter
MASLYAAMVGLGLLGAVSDATLNHWAESHRNAWLLVSYALWLAVATLFGLILRAEHLSFGIAVIIFLMANSAFALALDALVFGGSVTSRQWLGLALAGAAVCLLELGRAPGQA